MNTYNCGLYSKQGDIKAFAKNIIRLVDDPQMRRLLVSMGESWRKERFDSKNWLGIVGADEGVCFVN